MTNRESLEVIERLGVDSRGYPKLKEALDIAIKALKETDMGLNNGDHLHPFGEPFGWTEEEIQKHSLRELLKEVDNKNDDLIRRQDAIGLIRGMYPSSPILPSNRRKWEEKYEQFIRVEREISRLPSAQPEIIRCRDCKDKSIYKFPPTYDEKHYCERHEKVTELDNYCSWAERKDNG